MIIAICVIVWELLGFVGYMMMRQGFLVEFEDSLGKQGAWGMREIGPGIILFPVIGPGFIVAALCVQGKVCFKKRQSTQK